MIDLEVNITATDIAEGQKPHFENDEPTRIRHCPGFRAAKRAMPKLNYLTQTDLIFETTFVHLSPAMSRWITAADHHAEQPDQYPRPRPATFTISVPEECLGHAESTPDHEIST